MHLKIPNMRQRLSTSRGEAGAPEIVALGRGTVAEKIIALAKESRVPIHESPELAYALSNLGSGRKYLWNCTRLLPKYWHLFCW